MTRRDDTILMPLTDLMEEIALSSAALREQSAALREMSRARRERTGIYMDWLRQRRGENSNKGIDRTEVQRLLQMRIASSRLYDGADHWESRPARSTARGS